MTYNVFGGTLSLTQSINHSALSPDRSQPSVRTQVSLRVAYRIVRMRRRRAAGSDVHSVMSDLCMTFIDLDCSAASCTAWRTLSGGVYWCTSSIWDTGITPLQQTTASKWLP